MDEPFSALDPLIRRQLQDQFMALSAELHKTTVFITHDLDEAIRIGNRIAIMKDGRIVQIGTPEDIVTNPADDYVKDFVEGISKLKLVFAHSIMEKIDELQAGPWRKPQQIAARALMTPISIISSIWPSPRTIPSWFRTMTARMSA